MTFMSSGQVSDSLHDKLQAAEERCDTLGQQLQHAQQEACACQAQMHAAHLHAQQLQEELVCSSLPLHAICMFSCQYTAE